MRLRGLIASFGLVKFPSFVLCRLRLTELAPHRAAIETSVVIDVENLLLTIDDQEHLLAVDFVVGTYGLLQHSQIDLGAVDELDLLHREAVADAATLRNIGAAETMAARISATHATTAKIIRFIRFSQIRSAARAPRIASSCQRNPNQITFRRVPKS